MPPISFDAADVPHVAPDALNVAFCHLISQGRGLALLHGLAENQIREVEDALWRAFPHDAETRLAAALRFRALIEAFGARRLKDLLLHNGFKTIQTAVSVASTERLNARFGFRRQAFVMALSDLTTGRIPNARDFPVLARAA
ncbi:MAG: hypothetical protein ACT4OU_05270 [Hyphomicrobium sp.]